ncbi:hypothetical protein V6N13_134208 [Hibiscus sabdariffa]
MSFRVDAYCWIAYLHNIVPLFANFLRCWFRNDEALKLISLSMVFIAHWLCFRTVSLFLRCVQREQLCSFSLTLFKAQPPLKPP